MIPHSVTMILQSVYSEFCKLNLRNENLNFPEISRIENEMVTTRLNITYSTFIIRLIFPVRFLIKLEIYRNFRVREKY